MEGMYEDQYRHLNLTNNKRTLSEDTNILTCNQKRQKRFKSYRGTTFLETINESTSRNNRYDYDTRNDDIMDERRDSLNYVIGDNGDRQDSLTASGTESEDTDFTRFVSSNQLDRTLSPVLWETFVRRDYDSLMKRFGDDLDNNNDLRSQQTSSTTEALSYDDSYTKAELGLKGKKLHSGIAASNENERKDNSVENGTSGSIGHLSNSLDTGVLSIPDKYYVALDCEMVGVSAKGSRSALARCSIVDYNGCVIYDQYIKPSEEITDYRTRWSGITPLHMHNALPEYLALKEIHKYIENRIVIGHAVYNDFSVIKMQPPFHMVRDTAQCKLLVEMAQLEGQGNSLKKLSLCLLDKVIQSKKNGHDSVEDALATLELFKLVRSKWEPELFMKWRSKGIDIKKCLHAMEEYGNKPHDVVDYLSDEYWPALL